MRQKAYQFVRKALSCLPVEHGPGLRILTYHRVDYSNQRLNVLPDRFKEQMKYLSEAGYITLKNEELFRFRKSGFPEKSIMITFDDGYKNNYTNVFPCLVEHGINVVIFLITDYIGKEYTREQILGWNEIKEMSRHGIDFGSHACAHRRLTELPQSDIKTEVECSKKIIEDNLGKKADLFCYPKGYYDRSVKEIVKAAGYRGACATEVGGNDRLTDVFSLKRTEISLYDDLEDFKAKLQGRFDLLHGAYATWRRIRGE